MINENTEIADIVFVFPETFSDEKIDEEISGIKSKKLNLAIRKRVNEAYNGFEWIIPTVFAAFILKPYFDSFLSEAGKDHYNILKASLKKLIEKGKTIRTAAIPAIQSPDKLSQKYSQSLTVSIELQTINDRHIKLLFDNNLDINDWDSAVEQILELLVENYENFPNDTLTIEINNLDTKQHRIIYSIINPETKKLEFKDDQAMLQKYNPPFN